MSEKLWVRSVRQDWWQWRAADAVGEWLPDSFESGDTDALAEALQVQSLPVWLILSGQEVVTQEITFAAKERRHLSKLIPYELEDQIVDTVEDQHFTFSVLQEDQLAVSYLPKLQLQQSIQTIESLGHEVFGCGVDFLMLARDPESWTLAYDEDVILVHTGLGLGFAVEITLAPHFLATLFKESELPLTIRLVAPDQDQLDALKTLLEPYYNSDNLELEFEELQGNFWDAIAPQIEMDLRQGDMARQLPFARWWRDWRLTGAVAAAALVLSFSVNLGGYWSAKSEQRAMQTTMKDLYREAVPSGAISDPEKQLQQLVKGLNKDGEGSNLMVLLGQVTPLIAANNDLSLSSFRYSSDQRELRLNIEAKQFALLEELRSKLSGQGLNAELLRVSAQGDIHQASMKIQES